MKTKKLLFIGAYPLPYGGIASHLYELLPQLVKRGYEVVSLTPSVDDKIIRSTRMKNIFINIKKYFFRNPLPVLLIFVRAFQCKKDLGWKEFIKVIGFSRAITTIMLEENIDAVFVYDNYNGLVIPLLKEHFKVSPQIAFMIFGDLYLFPDKYKAISGYLKSVFIHCDIILASSRYCGDSIAKVLGYKTAVKVIYIGVDQTLYAPAKTGVPMRVELAIPPFATVFLFLARMTESMGLDFILQNAQHLLRIHQNIYLILAGAQGSLSRQAQELSIREPRVKYCPDITFKKKPAYYASCDIFLAPTMEKHPCMGVSIKEAMACGKPVIASAAGGIPEAIEDGVNGYLIPIKNGKLDKEVFLNRASCLSKEPSLCIKLGEDGRDKFLRLFTNERTVQQYIEMLETMLA